MNNNNPASPPAPTSSPKMIMTLGLVATLSGFLVVMVFQVTKDAIAENKRIAIERAIFQVVPAGAVTRRTFILNRQGIHKEGEGFTLYAAYNDKGELAGIAAESAAQGYADLVRLIYGYDPSCECVTGFKVIKMAETPGLGDKIIKDEVFLKNFEALDVKLNEEGTALKNEIEIVKRGNKQHPWQIDAISGATISSRAVGKAINESAKHLLPVFLKHKDSIAVLQD